MKIFKVFLRLKRDEIYDFVEENYIGLLLMFPPVFGLIFCWYRICSGKGDTEVSPHTVAIGFRFVVGYYCLFMLFPIYKWLYSNWQEAKKIVKDEQIEKYK